MEGPPTESRGSEWTPRFLNSFSERSLRAAGSRPSPRLGPQFMSTGLHMNVSLASIQHAIKVYQGKIKVTILQRGTVQVASKSSAVGVRSLCLKQRILRDVTARGEITAMQPRC